MRGATIADERDFDERGTRWGDRECEDCEKVGDAARSAPELELEQLEVEVLEL